MDLNSFLCKHFGTDDDGNVRIKNIIGNSSITNVIETIEVAVLIGIVLFLMGTCGFDMVDPYIENFYLAFLVGILAMAVFMAVVVVVFATFLAIIVYVEEWLTYEWRQFKNIKIAKCPLKNDE